MRVYRWMYGTLALGLALGVAGGVSAANDSVTPPVRLAAADKPAKKARTPKLSAKAVENLEKLAGKALTDDQKQQLLQAQQEKSAAIKAANAKFHEQTAKILGMTEAELTAKEKEMRAKARAEKKAKGAG